MKTGKSPRQTGYKINLPQEIIAVIINWVHAFPQEKDRKKAFWSCCFLSKSWYSAAIPYLYKSPKLSNKNFDRFARTLCPPVNSHVRHIGLESFVCHLDMGHLAYESSKSLTARMLRRTRVSLESFVAPSVSFSVAGLAPLSKCFNLRSLDLSRDSYDISLPQLLHAVAGLPLLAALSLPRAALSTSCTLRRASTGQSSWPSVMTYLQINDVLPTEQFHWDMLLLSLPPTLTSLAFEYCLNWDSFRILHEIQAKAVYVRTLRIGMRREEDGFPFEILLRAFPSLRSLAIPVPDGAAELALIVSGLPGMGSELRHLAFRPTPDTIQPKPKLKTNFLLKCVEICHELTQIEIPEIHIDISDEPSEDANNMMTINDLDEIERLMNARAGPMDEDTGIFLT